MKKKCSIIVTLVIMLSFIQTAKLNCYAYPEVQSLSQRQDAPQSKNIVDIASSDSRFKTLVTALKAAGLVDTLKGEGPFTVFAPTDDAFSKLPAGQIDELLKPENKKTLVNILTYHVTPGKVTAKDAIKLNGKEVPMLNGAKAKIEVKDNQVYIDGAKVIVTDIMAKNGIIHVIDTVMTP